MTPEQKVIRAQVGLLELAKPLGTVSRACKMMGHSRDSFHCFNGLRHQRDLRLCASWDTAPSCADREGWLSSDEGKRLIKIEHRPEMPGGTPGAPAPPQNVNPLP